ncbi:MAG: hypothetical protein AB9842_03755 [Bacteroidales bacterium]
MTEDKVGTGNCEKAPPVRGTGVISDIRAFILNKPEVPTLITFNSEAEREQYCQSILQRHGIHVESYRVLNIHRIGIDAPASYVFNELLKWNGDSSCWPNHIARVSLQDGKLERIQINLFGRTKSIFGRQQGILGFRFSHLFDLKAIKIQRCPAPFDVDNARYLLYQCTGGYPIGVFSMYVRTSIPERGEQEMSQLFMMVGFNFYGKKSLSRIRIIRFLWQWIHNRVTNNVANRFKQLCEWRFEKFSNPKDSACQ